jgi:hypothetical protein
LLDGIRQDIKQMKALFQYLSTPFSSGRDEGQKTDDKT